MIAKLKPRTAYMHMTINKGDDIAYALTWSTQNPTTLVKTVVDFTGATAHGGIKTAKGDVSDFLALTVTLSGISPNIQISATKTQTASLSYGEYYFYVYIDTPDSKRRRYIEGVLKVV